MIIPTEIQVSEVVWTGRVTYRHLTLLMESREFLDIVSQKLSALGYAVVKFSGISAVTETIEDLVVALDVHMNKCDTPIHRTIHVEMDGFKITFH